MATKAATKAIDISPCSHPCTRIIKFMTNRSIPGNTVISIPPYQNCDGFSFINITVRFNQLTANEAPVDLGVIFAFDANGDMGSRRYTNLENNVPGQQSTNFIDISGAGSWHGSPHNISVYNVRIPVMGPWVQVFPFNKHPVKRTVSVWGYLVG